MFSSPENLKARYISILLLILGTFFMLSSPQPAYASEDSKLVLTLEINGTINPAVGDYLDKGFKRAREHQAYLILIQMDTPGGLDASMRDIIQNILTSKIPVATYVSPDGARAASAGTYILYASHIAAMAPATNLGAATPIQIGGLGGAEGKNEDSDEGGKSHGKSVLERKIINDASAYIRALANRHGRNGDWAVEAVREAVSLTAHEALELNVINIIAENREDLLKQVDGWEIRIEGETILLKTGNVRFESFNQSWRYKLLGVISDPSIAYLLLLLGFYGLIYELANPGFLLPGVAGGISLMLALYAFQLLPVNYSGLALMILGVGFLIGEAFLPSFGTLGIGGIIAFTVGSLILVDEQTLRISLPLIIGMAAVSVILVFILIGRASMMRKKRLRTGVEAMIGMVGESRTDFVGAGMIWLNGESWNAQSSLSIKKGDKVKILSIAGLNLIVEPLKEGF